MKMIVNIVAVFLGAITILSMADENKPVPALGGVDDERNKPNIVMILVDDMGYKDLSCYGSTFYETPNIDKLFANGMHFTDAYAASPVCTPTRASLLSGKYPANLGVTFVGAPDEKGYMEHARLSSAPYIDHLPLEEKSLAAALRENGYQTWHVGKWHLGAEAHGPEGHGFDLNIGGSGNGMPVGGYFSPWERMPGLKDADVPEGTYLTDYLTDRACDLIEKKGDEPFFLNMWYYSVHVPIEAKAEKIRKYEAKARRLQLDQMNPIVKGERHPLDPAGKRTIERRIVQSHPVYAAMIESLDENIGRLMDTLERTGKLENTLILFTSDNGGLATAEGSPTCNAPLSEGKGWMYEGGVREPMILHWPGRIAPGSTCAVPVSSPDIYPTLLEMAGLDLMPEQHTDGISLKPLLEGGAPFERGALFWHYPHYGNQGGSPGAAIRMGDWKLIEFFEDNRLELYNLREDISESKNVAEDEPERTRQLHARLKDWQKQVNAKFPVPNANWGAHTTLD